MSNILANIPGIHATFVGILAAFFSAFVFFAYQKIIEAKIKLDDALDLAQSVSTPNSFYLSGQSSIADKDGNLDWDNRCMDFFNRVKSICYKISIEKYTQQNHWTRDPVETMQIVNELLIFFYLFFISYPINITLIDDSPSTGPSKKNNHSFDYNRYLSIKKRIYYLSRFWNENKESLVYLFNYYDQIQHNEREKDKTDELRKMWQDLGNGDDFNTFSEKHRIHINLIEQKYNHTKRPVTLPHLMEFFNKVMVYHDEVMPILDKTVTEFESYNNKFKIKQTTKITISMIIYITVIGIIIPIFLNEIKVNDQKINCILLYVKYFIFISSFAPYFLICMFLNKKIEQSIFK